jgi:hypothetical protein
MADARGRSTFVTAVSWIFIALAGFAAVISAAQNVMVNVMLATPEVQSAFRQAQTAPNVPTFAAAVFDHVRLIFFAFFILSTGTLITAVGLLRRKNWARIAFIGLMVFGVLWNVLSVGLTFVFFSTMPMVPSTAPNGFADQLAVMSKVMIGFNVVVALLFSILFAWIAKRLLSAEIQFEFART